LARSSVATVFHNFFKHAEGGLISHILDFEDKVIAVVGYVDREDAVLHLNTFVKGNPLHDLACGA